MDQLTQQLQANLEGELAKVIERTNVGTDNPAIKAAITNTALQMARNTSSSVTNKANKNLIDIPQNAIGPKNAFDIVAGNLGSADITNGMSNLLNNQLGGSLTSQLVNTFNAQLNTNLPDILKSKLNLSSLTAGLGDTLSSVVNTNIQSALSNFSTELFKKPIVNPPVVPNISTFFSGGSGEQALENVNKQFSTNVANKYVQKAASFNIQNEDNNGKLAVVSTGFSDPQAKFPLKEYDGISETNKLAQGDVNGTIVQKKNLSRMIEAKLPGGESWSQPESPFKGEYPFNKVTQTESGHIIEMDDTPGSERLQIYHRSGTFVEIDANGSVVKRAVGSSYEIIDKNNKVAISGRADISVSGNCNIFVGNDANIEVEGDTNLTCHNDVTAMAGGKMNLSAVEEMNITSANVNIEAYHTMNMKSNINLNMHVTKDFFMRSNTNMYFQTTTYYGNTTNSYHQTLQNSYDKHGGTRYIQAGGQFNLRTGSTINMDGSQTWIQSGRSAASQDSKPSIIADISKIGIMTGRKDILTVELSDPVFMSMADVYALKLEEEPQTSKEYADFRDEIVTAGFSTFLEFDTAPILVETENVSSQQSTALPGDDSLLQHEELPGNYNLSPNFTLEMLSSSATISKDFVRGTDQIKYGQIVKNLQQVALNVLEPAFNLYPNLLVASGYRSPLNSSESSQHPLGKAVDIHLQGFTREELFKAAKLLALSLNYDMFILQYCSYAKVPWLHISYDGGSNRKQVLTFYNNKRYSSGLSNLK